MSSAQGQAGLAHAGAEAGDEEEIRGAGEADAQEGGEAGRGGQEGEGRGLQGSEGQGEDAEAAPTAGGTAPVAGVVSVHELE